jgi:hypothetical protein
MYKKAVHIPDLWAFAYEVPMGGYALSLLSVGDVLRLDDEPQFACIQSLEAEMQEIAPLEEWSQELFENIIDQQKQAYS